MTGHIKAVVCAVIGGVWLALASVATAEDATQTAAKTDGTGLEVHAVIMEGAGAITKDVSFSLHSTNGRGDRKLEASGTGGQATLEAEPGEYILTTVYGATTRQQKVRIDDEGSRHVVNLDAGEITLDVIRGVGQPSVTKPIEWTIMTYGKNSNGNRKVVYEETAVNPFLVLPEGWYVVHAVNEGEQIKHTIEVTSGVRYDYTLVHY
ncbi:hypothetical protein [Fodinicurvata fenggangensis]|uniref:hypothetical protein n=1 Tax=Fodinicurvata fenggangensis TaxID=1121830 RepID=UPI00047DF52B|nr:hypothetical protein [Fodinicurvata fenggangensis]